MSKSKKKKRMMQKIDARINKPKPRKQACIEVEARVPRHKEFGSSMGLAIAEARRNKHG